MQQQPAGILQQTTRDRQHATDNMQQTSCNRQQPAGILQPTTRDRHCATSGLHPAGPCHVRLWPAACRRSMRARTHDEQTRSYLRNPSRSGCPRGSPHPGECADVHFEHAAGRRREELDLARVPRPHLRRDWARPGPHLRRDWAHPGPHLHRDRAHPGHICAETGLTPATSAPGLGSPRRPLLLDRARAYRICAAEHAHARTCMQAHRGWQVHGGARCGHR